MTPITQDDIFELIKGLLNFPYPQVCRHMVMGDLIWLLEKKGFPAERLGRLAKAVVEADDFTAMQHLEELTLPATANGVITPS